MISRGSEWHRWEPHIHAPGTILNNQFGATDPWVAYLKALEGLTPKIEAIAVTDYYVTDTYEEFLKYKTVGRLPDVKLLFPNIEVRLDVAAKSGFVNVHLLVSPEDSNHLAELKRILTRLQFHAHGDRFDCTRDELIRLGKRADPSITDDGAALAHGATQFKVNFDQARHAGSSMSATQWEEFLLIYKGNVDQSLTGYIGWADQEVAKLNGLPLPAGDPGVPLIADNADIAALPLAPIAAEMARLETVFSADKLVRDQYSALTRRIAQEISALQTLEKRLIDVQGAADRRKALQSERDGTYGRVFDAIIGEQDELAALYASLMARFAASSGTLKKLAFSVRRIANVEEWGSFAEEKLLDRRKAGPFYGRRSLIAAATQALKPAWESGSAAQVKAAMAAFMATYLKDLLSHAPFAANQQAEFRAWSKQFAHWLYGTDHITVRYEISYDGVDIRKLSPGTRGIVLLLLYLALDDTDDRPLIIDQPEENLDPKSVFDELAALFIAAKAKRQVIIVTHNANLVINTDADQIIVAEAGPHPAGGLPPINYVAGGLENAAIRKAVCDILEGGEAAFRERARRLRVHLDR